MDMVLQDIVSETNSSHLKMDDWKMEFLFGAGLSPGVLAVSFREGIYAFRPRKRPL